MRYTRKIIVIGFIFSVILSLLACPVYSQDSDGDGIEDSSDNCPSHHNPGQEDTYPPQGNGIGNACECEGDFDCDPDVDGTDAFVFKSDFGRSKIMNPCTNSAPCNGDFLCDRDVDGTDAFLFKSDFGRSGIQNPCTACAAGTWCDYSPLPPPDPEDVAPPLDPTVATDMHTATEFLYTGDNPIQTGVAPVTIEAKRVAVLRGRVLDREKAPLSGVTIAILNHPEYGQTISRSDGMFDMAVNGGGYLTVDYQKEGYLPAQRKVNVPWQDYAWLPDVVLIQLDPEVTIIDLTVPIMQVARGRVVTDDEGARQATILFPQGTEAELVLPGGSTQPVSTLHVRATEYTVGPNGPAAMPAELPSTVAYTYAVELSSDEAIAAGAQSMRFSQTVCFYVDNFLSFPCGTQVPTAFYDREKTAWMPIPDGRVISIVSVNGGMAELDTDGDEIPDNGVSLGVTDAERQQLGSLYTPGQSLWRIAVSHFTPLDCNYPSYFPPDATDPKQKDATVDQRLEDPSVDSSWGDIEAQNQIFGESLPVTGSPFLLHYSSDRVPGYHTTLKIPLSGDSVPSSLRRIDLEVSVAGKQFIQSYDAAANQSAIFSWDGRDAYGRNVQGAQTARVRIGYVYSLYYAMPRDVAESFGLSGMPFGEGLFIPSRQEATCWQEQNRRLDVHHPSLQAFGGWSLSVHHTYDPAAHTIYLGNGKNSRAYNINAVITTVAGNGQVCGRYNGVPLPCGGEGIPALEAALDPKAVAVGPDGSIYIADYGRIRRVDQNGIITTVAGTGEMTFSSCDYPIECCRMTGNGGPATEATICDPWAIVFGPDGSLYFASGYNANSIGRVSTDGIFTIVAGTGDPGFSGDGGPATEARLYFVNMIGGLAVGPDGSIYIPDADNHRIRRVGPDGIINTIAGNGIYNHTGDGGLAIEASLGVSSEWVPGVALDQYGDLYVAERGHYYVRKVAPDGIINSVAGNGGYPYGRDDVVDGIPATQEMIDAHNVAVGPDGSLYITGLGDNRIRRVGLDGIINTVAGSGPFNQGEFGGDGGPATQGRLSMPHSVAFSPDGSFYIADRENFRIRRVSQAMPGFSTNEIAIASEDGSQIYQFDEYGRHLKTVNALTGATAYQFGYDAGGRLISITDEDGNVTTIERDGSGNATAIVAPFGQRTTLVMNVDGYLASSTNPARESTQFGYGNEGLLTSVTGPKGAGFTYTMTYDGQGRLTRAQGPAGGYSTLTRTDLGGGYQVAVITALNRSSSYLTETLSNGTVHYRNTFHDGTVAETYSEADGTITATFPDGTVATGISGPDPRFGMQAPFNKNGSATTGGLTSNRTSNRTAVLADPNDPLSVTSLTDIAATNGIAYTTTYNGATGDFTTLSPVGRQIGFTINTLGQMTGSLVSGMEPTSFVYDTRGRQTGIITGTGDIQRVSSMTYNADGYVAAITNPLEQTVQFSYDTAGRVLQQTLPDNRQICYGYDRHGNLTSLTTPHGTIHTFSYSPVDLVAAYIAPGPTVTTYAYNLDQQLTRITRPEGTFLDFVYDTLGRLQTLALPGGGQITRTYDETGRLDSITSADGSRLSFVYNGGLLTSEILSGAVAGSVSRTHENNFRLSSIRVNGENIVTYRYDSDGLLMGAGNLTLNHNLQNGLLEGNTMGTVTESWIYNGFGEATSYIARYGVSDLLSIQYVRDKLGRITQMTESIEGSTDIYEYEYDLGGRLTAVKKNNMTISSYTYDDNGNRLSFSSGSSTVTGIYDDQDRLVSYGPSTYQYTLSGELEAKTTGSETTDYNYDALGNLVRVVLPGGSPAEIRYLVDGRNRRIGKEVNGTLVKGLLYIDQLSPVAELDGNNNPVSHFVYASRSTVPDYIMRGGATYRILSDHLGSPRLIVNITTGEVAQRMDYDEFGRVLLDTNPGYQPFGFAGGMYDPDTGLVHYGAREYDPVTGRWTSKDPLLFASGDPNLYRYALNNPVNLVDPQGLGIGLGGLPTTGLLGYLSALLTSKWIVGSDEGRFMARYGVELWKEAYRIQIRLFGHLIHAAHNTDYPGWRGIHAAYDKIHAYFDRMVRPGAPGSGVAWQETPTTFGRIISSPYVKKGVSIGGKASLVAGGILLVNDFFNLMEQQSEIPYTGPMGSEGDFCFPK